MHIYAKFDQNISWFKSYKDFHLLFMERTDAQQTLLHQKGCFACQWSGNVDMHINKINTPSGPRVKNIFTIC